MSSWPTIPDGFGYPLVDMATHRLPTPAIEAIAESPELAGTIDAAVAAGITPEMAQDAVDSALDTAGVVTGAQIVAEATESGKRIAWSMALDDGSKLPLGFYEDGHFTELTRRVIRQDVLDTVDAAAHPVYRQVIRVEDGPMLIGFRRDGQVDIPHLVTDGTLVTTVAQRKNVVVPTASTFALEGVDAFYVYGINFGIHNTDGTASYRTMWGAQWSNEWAIQQIDRIHALGANTIRIMGSYKAYSDNPLAYKQRFEWLLEQVRPTGMKVIFCLMTWTSPNEEANEANIPAYLAMVDDLLPRYLGDKMILGWDVGNEFEPATNSQHFAIVQAMCAKVKALDPDAKVTMGNNTGRAFDNIALIDPYVDFHDIHFYENPNTGFSANPVDDLRYVTKKPILFGEIGANYTTGAGNDPKFASRLAQGEYIAAARRFTVADVMGVVVHKISDTGTPNKFGMYDEAGDATPVLREYMKYPNTRLQAVRDAIDAALVPVVVDNFARATSNTVVGTSPLGGTPVQRTGTWGISSGNRLINPTSVGSGLNILTWETNSADGVVEMEALTNLNTSTARLGLVLRYVDNDNYLYLCYGHSPTEPNGTLQLFKCEAGVTTDITPPAVLGGASGVPITGNYSNVYVRLRAVLRGSYLGIYQGSTLLTRVTGLTTFEKATIHGVGRSHNDSGNPIGRFRVLVSGRTY